MEKKMAGLIGVVAAGAMSAASATPMVAPAPSDVLKVNSFADLLEPIPNAVALLQAVDEASPASANENVQLAQYHHHHHHHHHSHYGRRYAPRVVIIPPRYRRHHHHHHHHHSFYRRDY